MTLSGPWSCKGTGGGVCSAGTGGAAGGNAVALTAAALPAGGCINISVPVKYSANPADY